MKTSFKFFLTGIASLALVVGSAVLPAIAELSQVAPPDSTDPENPYPGDNGYGGFPRWYQDTKGLKLDLCLDPSIDRNPPGLCLTDPPNPGDPYVDDFNAADSNFPDEAFWWTAEAEMTTPSGARALLVLATEAAFANEEPIHFEQMAFNRIRVRIRGGRNQGGLVAGAKYKISHPYGELVLTATRKKAGLPAEINSTQDFACAVTDITACNFGILKVRTNRRGVVVNPIGAPWLTSVFFNTVPNSTDPVLSGKYVGDPNIEQEVQGSPVLDAFDRPQNYFKLEKAKVDANGNVVRDANGRVMPDGPVIAQTNLFSVSGKVSTAP